MGLRERSATRRGVDGCGLRQGRRLRAGMTKLHVPYVVGIVPQLLMWAPGSAPTRMDSR